MTVLAKVHNGSVALDPLEFPEGADVRIELIVTDEARHFADLIEQAAAMRTPEQDEEDAAFVQMGSTSAISILERENAQRPTG